MNRPLSLTLAAVLLTAGAAPALAETAQEAAAYSLKRHPALAADRSLVRAGEDNVRANFSGFLPMASVDAEFSRTTYTRSNLPLMLNGQAVVFQANQLVFDGLRTASRFDASRAERRALGWDYVQNANAVLYNVLRAFNYVVRDREILIAARQNHDEHVRSVGRLASASRFDTGKQFDLNQIQAREAFASSITTEREGALRQSEALYRELVFRDVPAVMEPSKPIDKGPGFGGLADSIAVSEQRNPMIQAAKERAERRELERREANGALVPRVDFIARRGTGVDRNGVIGPSDDTYLGFRGTYEFPVGGGTVFAWRSAEQTARSAEERLDEARRAVREQLRGAWATRNALVATIPPARAHYERSKKVLEGYKTQYTLGRRTVLDLLIIQNETYQAEARLANLLFDKLVTDYQVAFLTGTIGDVVPVIPSETYDPLADEPRAPQAPASDAPSRSPEQAK